jgi:hypothetical protein
MPSTTTASPGTQASGTRRARERQKPFWERGYKSHGFWLGKVRIGVVDVEPGKHLEMKYRWQAANHTGQCTTLKDAKRMVEQTVLLGGRQLQLFDEEVLVLSPTRA